MMFSTLQIPQLVARNWDPFDFPSAEFRYLRTTTERTGPTGQTLAPLSVWEDEQGVYIEVEVPGVRPENLDVRVEEGKLRISGERSPIQRDQKCWYEERAFGRFERVIRLSDAIDPSKIEANLRDGVLSLKLHKRPEALPQRVTVRYEADARPANGSGSMQAIEQN